MRLGAFELNEPLPELKEPHALAMLDPWINAGGVGTLILAWLEKHLQAKELARLVRPGSFFDFTRYRPTSLFKEGRREIILPNTYITCAQPPAGHDFLFLHLLEPHSHSDIYVESVSRLLARFGVTRYCLIGSMYDYVPHTRPLIVTGGAVGRRVTQELERLGVESSNYQGPTTILSQVIQRAPDMGMETMSLIVHLPQYTQLDEDYSGAVRLMEMLGLLYGIPADEAYYSKAKEQLDEVNQALDRNPQLKAIVREMESSYEERLETRREERPPPHLSPEVEKFLSDLERGFKDN
jgi:hypothetical protein